MPNRKIIVLTYYWPPSGGSGVQRWVYFTHYLQKMGWTPIVITVDPEQASYPQQDVSLADLVTGIRVIRTRTCEPLQWYARWLGRGNLPQGAVPQRTIFHKIAAFIRGNFFIPDARKGWRPYAQKALKALLDSESIEWVVSTGPPHSTHLAVLPLRKTHHFRWLVDFRDPWSDLFYNQQLYRLAHTLRKDVALEQQVLQAADTVLTTVGGSLHDRLRNRAPNQRFAALANGFDAEKMTALKREPLPGGFHVVYTGLLTQNQDFPAFVTALQQLESPLPIRFSLAGQIDPEIITTLTEALPDVAVVYLGYRSHTEVLQLMHQADVLVNFIFKGASTQMISGKLLEYMATGVPVLSLGDPDSEAARLLTKSTAAQMMTNTDVPAMVAFLEKALRQKGKWLNEFPQKMQWSREGIAQRLVEEVLYYPKN